MNNHLVLVSTHKYRSDGCFLYGNAVQKLISNMDFFNSLGYFAVDLSKLSALMGWHYGHEDHLF